MDKDTLSIIALIVIVLGITWALWIDHTANKEEKRVRKELRSLQGEWPFFSALALEWRVRSFCEAYFTKFRKGRHEAILPHCTPELFAALSPDPNSPPVPEFDSPGEVLGLVGPQPFQVLTPDNDRPPTVVMLVGINFEDRSMKDGFEERKYLFFLTYEPSGDWLLDEIVEANLSMRDAPPGELDLTWLRSNSVARPSAVTLHPEGPRIENGGKFNGAILGGCIIFLLVVSMALFFLFQGWAWEKKNTRLRESGERIEARVNSHEYNADYRKYRIKYSFVPPGWEESFENQTNLSHGDHAEVNARAGEAAVASGTIEVAYDPEDPSVNCAVATKDKTTRALGDQIGVGFVIISGVACAIFFGRNFLLMRRKDFSPFWFLWNRSVRANRKQSLRRTMSPK